MGDGRGGHWLVRMEWRPAGWSVCLPLLIFPCTIKSIKFSSGTGSPGWSQKKGRITVVCVWVKFLRPTRHKTGYFGDVLPSQSLGIVLKLNPTQQKQTRKQWNSLAKPEKPYENVKTNAKKLNLNLNQHSCFRTIHMCVHVIVYNCYTQHSTEQFW